MNDDLSGVVSGLLSIAGCHSINKSDASNQVNSSCPFAFSRHSDGRDGSPSFTVNLEPPLQAYCFACHSKGWLPLMLMDIASLRRDGELFVAADSVFKSMDLSIIDRTMDILDEKEKAEKLRAQQDFVSNLKPAPIKVSLGYEVFDESQIAPFMGSVPSYAINRGITIDIAKRWEIGYDKHKEHPRMVFPVRDRHKNLVGLVGRRLRQSTKSKYYNYWNFSKGKFLYGMHLHESDWVVVTEGQMDAIILDSYGIPTVAIMGSKMSNDQEELLCEYKKVFLALDGDEEGVRGTLDAIDRLKDRVILHLLNIARGKDPADYGKEAIESLLSSADML